ncbi:hypothetical protein TNIN_212911 [Trichonephila inaurata madagascariensis]|uniref:Uncharacterized protein n=1 Tax=Trichonephila inaurata madagascariensis TaxID=2747483 RepID=A0A8X7BT05_9ARAC|nr:hypothetical protein TNIN_212911 [Trichonephila inaurata madagascariensis]
MGRGAFTPRWAIVTSAFSNSRPLSLLSPRFACGCYRSTYEPYPPSDALVKGGASIDRSPPYTKGKMKNRVFLTYRFELEFVSGVTDRPMIFIEQWKIFPFHCYSDGGTYYEGIVNFSRHFLQCIMDYSLRINLQHVLTISKWEAI